MKDYIKPTKRDFDPDLYIFHTGTSDLSLAKYNAEIPTDIINLAESLKSTHSNVVVSTIVPHVDNFKENPQKSINALYQNVKRKIFHRYPMTISSLKDTSTNQNSILITMVMVFL